MPFEAADISGVRLRQLQLGSQGWQRFALGWPLWGLKHDFATVLLPKGELLLLALGTVVWR